MIPEDELSGLTNGQLRVLAGQVIAALEDKPNDILYAQLESIRDEMAVRIDPRDDGGASGVREPRRPRPGGSSAAAARDEEG